MKVLLINSEKPRTGKSTYVAHLQQTYLGIKHLAFALPIKDLSIQFASSLMDHLPSIDAPVISYDTHSKDKPIGGYPFGNTSPRELVCDVSDLYTKATNTEIWGRVAYEYILQAEKDGFEVVVFDDWRRFSESDYLKQQEDLDITTLHLSKEGVEFVPSSGSVASFEGNIKPLDCDLTFEFTNDWGNTHDLDSILSCYMGLKYNHG